MIIIVLMVVNYDNLTIRHHMYANLYDKMMFIIS